uniref:Secreted protein n=1 Tax=Romanomermis culicivorax TaxID=13658 RepID=A0A915J164_ROMCU
MIWFCICPRRIIIFSICDAMRSSLSWVVGVVAGSCCAGGSSASRGGMVTFDGGLDMGLRPANIYNIGLRIDHEKIALV